MIRCRVMLPSGNRAQPGILVRLSSNVTMSRSASTDVDGVVMFNALPVGEYRITVEGGTEYAPLNRSVTIYGTTEGTPSGRTGQTMMLDLVLQPNPDKAFPGVPKNAIDAYSKGMQFVASGENKKAVSSLEQAVSLHPQFGAALNELGAQYLKSNDAAKAAEVLKKATELLPDNYSAPLRFGIALLNLKKTAEAEGELRKALTLNPASAGAHMYLGIVLLSLSRDEKTKAFDSDKYAEAQKELETAVTSGKEDVAMAHRYLGGIYWGQKDHKRAADELETYLKLEPKAADAERTRAAIKDLRSKQ
ncbi:MAG TPA: tetratricopeptide repeat protein [Pyrinomonadaceae bacterium]|nr:tetratricopeptide repeat protein [Pyrinomonadaceae bacterium]